MWHVLHHVFIVGIPNASPWRRILPSVVAPPLSLSLVVAAPLEIGREDPRGTRLEPPGTRIESREPDWTLGEPDWTLGEPDLTLGNLT